MGRLSVILLFIFVTEIQSLKQQPNEISPAKAVDFINHHHALVVDLRENNAFRQGHIIDSVSASPDDFNQKKMEKHKSKPLILVCTKGLTSTTLASKLKKDGYQAMVLAGGINAWQAAGLPVIKDNKH